MCEGGMHFIIWFFYIFWHKYGLCEAEMFSYLSWVIFFPFQEKLLLWSGARGSQVWLVVFKQHGRRVIGHTRSEGWWDVFTGSHNSCSLQSFPGSFDLGNLARAASLWQLNASLWFFREAVLKLLASHCRAGIGLGRWGAGCSDCSLAPLPSPLASCRTRAWRCRPRSRLERTGTLLFFHSPRWASSWSCRLVCCPSSL